MGEGMALPSIETKSTFMVAGLVAFWDQVFFFG